MSSSRAKRKLLLAKRTCPYCRHVVMHEVRATAHLLACRREALVPILEARAEKARRNAS